MKSQKRLSTKTAMVTMAAVVTLATLIPSTALSQAYPVKPVRIILPYLGSTEFIGRWIAGKLSPVMGHQFVIDPRPGAGGKIGHELAAKAAPDGYTLMLGAPPLVINPHLFPKEGHDALRDFAPIAVLGTIPSVLVVHPSVPARSLRELAKIAQASPGKITFGSGAPGSPSHLAGELWKSISKTNILMVPYKGATFALVGAMSGEVDMVIPGASVAEPYVKDRRLRALAVLNTRPVNSMPDIPTAAQAGMPQLQVVNWFLLAAPTGTPRAVIDRLNTEVNKVMQAADTQKNIVALGGEVSITTPEQAAALVREEYVRWGKVIRDANIKSE